MQLRVRASIEAVEELAPQSPDCPGTPNLWGSGVPPAIWARPASRVAPGVAGCLSQGPCTLLFPL